MLFAPALIYSLLLAFLANSFLLVQHNPYSLYAIIPLFLAINLFAGLFSKRFRSKRTQICWHGTVLLTVFCISVVLSIIAQVIIFPASALVTKSASSSIWSAVMCFGVNALVFWNGILCVYCTSTQLGIRLRVIGVLCGMLPIVNLVILFFIIRTTAAECRFEAQKDLENLERKEDVICATKYPILMVHGVVFRDRKYFNYWGRIPAELERNGATIFYGNHQSARSVADSAQELKDRILAILEETGAEKVNIIAHSKGGIDCRYAIHKLGMQPYVASLATINTPHRGCLFADYVLHKIPIPAKLYIAKLYNNTMKKLGDTDPDFLAAMENLTDAFCQPLHDEMGVPEGIFCQSVGSVMKKRSSGFLPLNLSFHLAKYFDGDNDGLVSENSFPWGEKYTLLTPPKDRGIDHGDIVDMKRENIDGFDIREFYVGLVADLKNRGL